MKQDAYFVVKSLPVRTILFLALLLGLTQEAFAQSEKKPSEKIDRYWFVMLKPGPNRGQDSATAAKIQRGHLDNIDRLYREGLVKVAGPFAKNDLQWRGIFIMDCEDRATCEKHLQTDPAIESGRLVYDLVEWYTAPMGSFIHGKPEAGH